MLAGAGTAHLTAKMVQLHRLFRKAHRVVGGKQQDADGRRQTLSIGGQPASLSGFLNLLEHGAVRIILVITDVKSHFHRFQLGPLRCASVGYVRVSDDLPYVAVLALEVEPPALVQVVDLAVRARAGTAPEDDAFISDALQDRVELLVRGEEGVVIGLRVVGVVEVQRQNIVDLDRREVAPWALVLQTE